MSIANKQGNVRSAKQIDKCKLILQNPIENNGDNSYNLLGSSPDNIMYPLVADGGVIFDNTPSLSVVYTSSYTAYELMHSNYELNAYQKSSISDFQIQAARLTSETREKADYTLAVMQFFRTFTKMNYGQNDPDAGLPPRIMNFSAYGQYMFNNVPVAIRTYTIQLQDNVDYVQTSFGTQVPLIMDINITLTYMPTPSKIKREFSLNSFANGSLIKKGYLWVLNHHHIILQI